MHPTAFLLSMNNAPCPCLLLHHTTTRARAHLPMLPRLLVQASPDWIDGVLRVHSGCMHVAHILFDPAHPVPNKRTRRRATQLHRSTAGTCRTVAAQHNCHLANTGGVGAIGDKKRTHSSYAVLLPAVLCCAPSLRRCNFRLLCCRRTGVSTEMVDRETAKEGEASDVHWRRLCLLLLVPSSSFSSSSSSP